MRPLFAFIASSLLIANLSLAFPDVLITPGPLLKGHQSLKRECLSCHKPFSGTAAVQCITCHKPDEIGVRRVAGQFLPRNSSNPRALLHRGVAAGSCIDCHTDHKGSDASKALKTFRHVDLPKSLQGECTTCHSSQKPGDPLHRSAKGSCSECHGSKQWKPATFDHSRLAASSGMQCVSCHKADKPNDSLHSAISSNCSDCHGSKRWKPATFDHSHLAASSGKQCISCHKADKPNDSLHSAISSNCTDCHSPKRWKPATFDHNSYFRLDLDHRASCTTCHTDPGNYRKYTCYNCHEHSPLKVESKHRKKGIYNYQNCMRCHRNGSEG